MNVYQESSGFFSWQKVAAMAFETSLGLESHFKSDCSFSMAKSSNADMACGGSVLEFAHT